MILYSFSLPSFTYVLSRRSDTALVENEFLKFPDTAAVAADLQNRDTEMVGTSASLLGSAAT